MLWHKFVPAILVAGVSFAVPQFLVSNYHGPMLVDVVASLVSMMCLIGFLKIWQPKQVWTSTALKGKQDHSKVEDDEIVQVSEIFKRHDTAAIRRAWMPWFILTIFVFIWGFPEFKKAIDHRPMLTADGQVILDEKGKPKTEAHPVFNPTIKFERIHDKIEKVPPVVNKAKKEEAIYKFSWLSTTGTGIFLAAIVAGLFMGYSLLSLARHFMHTVWVVRYSLVTIVAMLALGYLTRYSGLDATLGLAFAHTGVFYPMFGTLLGWLGVALTGSDTASNVLFGGLQRTTAEQLGINPVLMTASNSSGGVMGKMVDAQSIVVASTATRWYGHEGDILRYVFFHSIALAVLVGFLVTLQAYVPPFTHMIPH